MNALYFLFLFFSSSFLFSEIILRMISERASDHTKEGFQTIYRDIDGVGAGVPRSSLLTPSTKWNPSYTTNHKYGLLETLIILTKQSPFFFSFFSFFLFFFFFRLGFFFWFQNSNKLLFLLLSKSDFSLIHQYCSVYVMSAQ